MQSISDLIATYLLRLDSSQWSSLTSFNGGITEANERSLSARERSILVVLVESEYMIDQEPHVHVHVHNDRWLGTITYQ